MLQQELQDRVQAEQPPPGPSLLQTLQDIGIQITEEQAAKLAGLKFQIAGEQDATLPSMYETDPPPPGNSQADMDVETPPGLQQVTHNRERNGRSSLDPPKEVTGIKPSQGIIKCRELGRFWGLW